MNAASSLRSIGFVLLFLMPCYAVDTSPDGGTLSLVNSPSNLTLLGWPPWFTINAEITHNRGPQMNDTAFFMNAVAAMEDLCFMNQYADLRQSPPRSWSLPQYDLLLDIWTSEVCYAVWALQLTAIVSHRLGYWPVIGTIMLHNIPEGRVRFQYRPPSDDNSTVVGNVENSTSNASVADVPNNNTTDLTVPLTAGEQVRVIPRYNGASMSTYDVFSRALGAMALTAAKGPDIPCNGIQGIPGLTVRPKRDDRGQSSLTYGHVAKGMSLLMRWMVAKKKFKEIEFELQSGGVKVGQGRIQNFQSRSVASQ